MTQQTLNYDEAYTQVISTLSRFAGQMKAGVFTQHATVLNVGLIDIFKMYAAMRKDKQNVYLCMPGEMGNECITLSYWPVVGCSIEIQSEPCVDMRWKVKQTKFNWN